MIDITLGRRFFVLHKIVRQYGLKAKRFTYERYLKNSNLRLPYLRISCKKGDSIQDSPKCSGFIREVCCRIKEVQDINR